MDPEQKNSTNKVIEYYKKYSQNPQLLKYFTGPEATLVGKRSPGTVPTSGYLEEPKQQLEKSTDEKNFSKDNIKNEESPSPESPSPSALEVNQTNEMEEKNQSRSSSVASNKIEWDNGADIGYKNSYLFLTNKKSASFPNLLPKDMSLNINILPKDNTEKSTSGNVEELRKMYNQLTFSSDTSNSTNKEMHLASKEQVTTSSSSEESKCSKTGTKSSSSSNSYLKKRIGYPVAYSTPHEESSSKQSTSNGSKESGSKSSKESSSKESNKDDAYTVTPMLTLPNKPKRNLNNLKHSTSTDKEECTKKSSGSLENRKDESNFNIVRRETTKKINVFSKEINLCLTKPVFVECVPVESKKSVHKDVQTSFSTEKLSKSAQTEELGFDDVISDPNVRYTPQIQNIEFINFSDGKSNVVPEFQHKSEQFVKTQSDYSTPQKEQKDAENCKATQTNVICIDDSTKSRETIHSAKKSQKKSKDDFARSKKNSINRDSSATSSANQFPTNKDSTDGNVDSTDYSVKSPVANDFKAEELLLAEMISLNYSKDLNTDIKRSINILQKLLKSRKYDEATKKYYVKKIVQKIVESKYSEDSASSDLFRPKSSTRQNTSEVLKTETNSNKKTANLMDNLPWYPACEPIHPLSKRKPEKRTKIALEKDTVADTPEHDNHLIGTNTLRDKTFAVPGQKVEKPEVQVQKSKTISISSDNNQPIYSGHVFQNKNYRVKKKFPKVNSNSSSELTNDVFREKDFRQSSSEIKIGGKDWRAGKTISEKILENRDILDFKKGQGDYLLHVVKNERHHQLSWINNEIEHLVKLKELLEKKPENVSPDSKLQEVISSLLKMKEKDMKVKSKSPLRDVGNNKRKTNTSKDVSPDVHKKIQVTVTTANHPPKYTENFTQNNQGDVEHGTWNTGDGGSPQQQLEHNANVVTCKCFQTATHEEKDIQCPGFRQCCTCQPSPREDANVQCDCKDTTEVPFVQGEEILCQCKTSSSSISNENSESTMSCICCKKDNILKNLINNIPLCEPCQKVNRSNFYPHDYHNPLHSCLCYKLVEQDLLCQFKQALSELQRLDIYQQYCEVLKNCKCCKKCGCKCKLPKRFKNGCAYFLKLEETAPDSVGEEERRRGDCCNCDEEEDRENRLPEVTVKVPSLRASHTRKKKNEDVESKHGKNTPSIQTYLCTMKPEFVARAERRRRILRDATVEREENSEVRKLNFIKRINYLNSRKEYPVLSESNVNPCCYQTNAYCMFDIELKNSPKKFKPKVFKSFREMKELTRKRYITLNEVKSKKDVHREKRLREANRLLANTFTKRLQRSTLKGAVDIPLNVKVVSF